MHQCNALKCYCYSYRLQLSLVPATYGAPPNMMFFPVSCFIAHERLRDTHMRVHHMCLVGSCKRDTGTCNVYIHGRNYEAIASVRLARLSPAYRLCRLIRVWVAAFLHVCECPHHDMTPALALQARCRRQRRLLSHCMACSVVIACLQTLPQQAELTSAYGLRPS